MALNRIAFVGLGAMGAPMAGHLARHGHSVTVYNRSPAKMEEWQKLHQGAVANSVSEAVQEQDGLITCVGNDDDLRSVVNEALTVMTNGFVIDHSTCSATIARKMAQLAAHKGCFFCDAPVSGGMEGAQQGTLSIMVGGAQDHVTTIEALLRCYGRTITHMGEVGTGQLAKMVNQICAAGVIQSLAEGLHFAQEMGLDTDALLQAITNGASSSWWMQNRAATMLDGQFDGFGFKVDWMLKDLRLAMEASSTPLETTALIAQFYEEVQQMGGGAWDSSALLARLQKRGN